MPPPAPDRIERTRERLNRFLEVRERASKAALAGLTRAAALDLAADQTLVNCICPAYTETDILPYATIQTRDATPRLELGRQLLPGSTYAFEISAVDHDGQVSPAVRSEEF